MPKLPKHLKYYETKSAGLGFSFLMELRASLEQIVATRKLIRLSARKYAGKP